MWYIYKMEYSAIRKNMDGHKDCHTEWSKSDREKCQMINLKKKKTNAPIYKTETHRQRNKFMVSQGKRWGRDKLGSRD